MLFVKPAAGIIVHQVNNSYYSEHYIKLPRPLGRGINKKKLLALATLIVIERG